MKNQHFRFPKKAKEIIMISNGTGIAPFLGMISENKKKIPVQLYCGFRKQSSFTLYETFLTEQKNAGQLNALHLTLSREAEKEYVSHRFCKHENEIWQSLKNGAVIMICGSLSMQNDVMKVLHEICFTQGNSTAATFADRGQILTDCY